MPAHRTTRRSFLQQSAGLLLAGAPALLRGQDVNSRLQLAFIGVGGRGGANLREMTRPGNPVGVDVVALCDVNAQHLERAKQQFPQARVYRDFRRLLDEAKDIDGVVVSTCEHTHAYATLPALQMGKAVYCEKPLTHNVYEARLVAQAAAAAGVATQMGTQMHATRNYRRVVELIQAGVIGPVREVHVWVSRAWGLQTEEEAKANNDVHGFVTRPDGSRVFLTDRPAEGQPVPDTLDWDLWLGPAPWRPFHEAYFPGPRWYRWWEFGNGTMSDLGSHWNDLPYWALKLDAPRTVEAHGIPPHPEIAPASMTAVYEYGPRGDLPACTLTWYQGTHKPALWNEKAIPQWPNGVLFVGSGGRMLLADYRQHVLLPEAQFTDFQPPEPTIPDSPGQHQEWLVAMRDGRATGSPFATYAGPLTEANHLGNVAYRAGAKIVWDAANLKITNIPEAQRFLARQNPREGWTLGKWT